MIWKNVRLFAALVTTTLNVQAADWPMYRADAARSGYTSDPLPIPLEIRWVRKAVNPPSPAWSGRDTRMPFDHSFQPVASGGTVFWGSSSDCRVYALDAESGSEKWTFFTDAPVRFAPALWRDRLFVVSDDGYLYCLSSKDGALLWKKRGGPESDMVLGNERLISRWPARGGPVIKEGIVYFGAGIWTTEGIYLYAVDAATGEVLWVNDSSGSLVLEQPHSGNRAGSGVSIQGYLAAAGNSLVVPTGRATPAVFERASGKFRCFNLMSMGSGWGRRKGAGPFVSFLDETLFVAEHDVFQVADGRFMKRGLPVSSTAVLPELVVFSWDKEIRAVKKSSLWIETQNREGKSVRNLSLDNIAWRIPCSDPVGASTVQAKASQDAQDWPKSVQVVDPPLIVAGNTIVAGTLNNKFVIADIKTKAVLATTQVDGSVLGLAVADEALYVSTSKGTVYCFSSKQSIKAESADARPRRNAPNNSSTQDSSDENAGHYAKIAQQITASSGIEQGYCLDLACGNGELAYALAKSTKLHIIAIDKDPAQVALARKKLSAAGLYGARVTVLQRDPSDTGLPSGFANLIVSGRSLTEDDDAEPTVEIKRLLHPYSGVALVGKPGNMRRVKREALVNAGEWTHQYANAANTLCAVDDLAKSPLKVLWFKDFGFQMPSRHGRGPAPLCRNGIMIIEGVHGLWGVDAYNGHKLWSYRIENILKSYDQEHLMGTAGTGSNMCLADDSVFVRQGNRALRINMKSGKLIREYTMPDKQGVWGFIASAGGVLYGSSADQSYAVRQLFRNVSEMKELLTQSDSLFALDIRTGALKWIYNARTSIRHNAIAIGDNRVYLLDKPKGTMDLPGKQKKDAAAAVDEVGSPHLVSLDADSGEVLWEQSADIYGTTLVLSTQHNILLMGYQYSQRTFQLPSEKGNRLTGFSSTDGKRLWDAKGKYVSRPIINGSTVYTQPYSYDLLTGACKTDFAVKGRQPGGCGPMSGSTHLLLYRSGTLGYTDLSNNTGTQNYGPLRPGCWINTIVAGGLVLMPDATDRCTCSYLIKASVALAPLNW